MKPTPDRTYQLILVCNHDRHHHGPYDGPHHHDHHHHSQAARPTTMRLRAHPSPPQSTRQTTQTGPANTSFLYLRYLPENYLYIHTVTIYLT